MEMWLRQATLVFLTAVAATGISGQAPVNLDGKPGKTVPFGSPLTLNCSVNLNDSERFRIYWYFNPIGPSFNETHKIPTKTSFKSKNNSQELLLNHTLSATKNNSGWYYCKVREEIPSIIDYNGIATEVIITFPEDEDKLWPWILLGVSAFILIVLVILCVLLRRRCCRGRDAEDPIYANTRPLANKQPSPRPGMPVDNLKASSQNLRNPSPGKRYDEGKRRHK